MSKYAVEVKDIKKSFFLPNHKNNSIKSAITQAFKPKEKGGKQFNALNSISFNVEKGDFFGILGRNGSGKSTLLKIISEIYQPTSGSVKHDGKVVSFIELGVGFKAELSGRENVYLNGGLLGFSKQEVDEMYDEIVNFAELEEFMDQKLKNYSSGMKVRLAFSVAIRAKADILILDEVLAVGDAAFQKKCYDYFRTLKEDNKTVILVTHGMGAVRDFCSKAIVIEGGKIIYEGDANTAADEYLNLFENDRKNIAAKNKADGQKAREEEEKAVEMSNKGSVALDSIGIYQDEEVVDEVRFGDEIKLKLSFSSVKAYENLNIAAHIMSSETDHSIIAATNKPTGDYTLNEGVNMVEFNIQNTLTEGSYYINVAIEEKQSRKQLFKKGKLSQFHVYGMDKNKYDKNTISHPDIKMKIG